MALLDQLRSLTRRLGLTRLLNPIVQVVEMINLRRLGTYRSTSLAPDQARLDYGRQHFIVIGPPIHFANMACSPHERPTLMAFLTVFAPLASGAVAWDVGANAGFYSAILSKLVTASGRVFAFEPVPDTHAILVGNLKTAGCSNVTSLCTALSDHSGTASISVDVSNNTTSSLEEVAGTHQLSVRLAAGDDLVNSQECMAPALVKLDIEGHELKALQGMGGILRRPECRAVLCEVHFSILAARGEKNAAAKATTMLRSAGFENTRWISRSHLLATKS